MSNPRTLIWAGFGLAAVLVAAAGWQLGNAVLASQSRQPDVGISYQVLTFNEMARAAELVVAGQVTAISPTRWNQDSGAWWEETATDALGEQTVDQALPYYEVTVTADKALVAGAGVEAAAGMPVVFTVIGLSPVDGAPADGPLVLSDSSAATAWPLGTSVVVFAERSDMAWRGGTRRILQPVGDPASAILRVGAAGPTGDQLAAAPLAGSLEELAAAVDAARQANDTE